MFDIDFFLFFITKRKREGEWVERGEFFHFLPVRTFFSLFDI